MRPMGAAHRSDAVRFSRCARSGSLSNAARAGLGGRTLRRSVGPRGPGRARDGSTWSDTLPISARSSPPRPWLPTTMTSAPSDWAASRIESAGSPSQIRKLVGTWSRRPRTTSSAAAVSSRDRSWSIRRPNRPPGSWSVRGSITLTASSLAPKAAASRNASSVAASEAGPRSVARTIWRIAGRRPGVGRPSAARSSRAACAAHRERTGSHRLRSRTGARCRHALVPGCRGRSSCDGATAIGAASRQTARFRQAGRPTRAAAAGSLRGVTDQTAATELLQAQVQLAQASEHLAALDAATRAIAGILDVDAILAADRRSGSRPRPGALRGARHRRRRRRHRALRDGRHQPEDRERIGDPPRGHGLLGPDHPRGSGVPDPGDLGASGQLGLPAAPPADALVPWRADQGPGRVGRQPLPDREDAARQSSPRTTRRSSRCSPSMPGSRSRTPDSTSRSSGWRSSTSASGSPRISTTGSSRASTRSACRSRTCPS